MSKVRDISNLSNVIRTDASGNVSFVSGSTTLATINTSGQLSGSSPVLSSSYASNAETLDGLDSTVFTLTSSFNAQTASFTAFTASVNSFTASQLVLNGKYATTGSNTFTGIQTINSNLVVTGSITAQTLIVSTINATQSYSSGSNIFGNASSNTQTFTGSVLISGSVSSTGAATFSSTLTLSTLTAGSILFAGTSGLISQNNGNLFYDNANTRLGINAGSSPAYTLSVGGTGNFTGALTGTSLALSTTLSINNGTAATSYIQFNYNPVDARCKSWRLWNDQDQYGDFAIAQATTQGGSTYSPKFLITTLGNIGMGTATPNGPLDIVGTTYDGKYTISLIDSAAVAANIGGGIYFGGNYTGTTKTGWAGIVGKKDNATDGQYGGYLAFYTRTNGSSPAERMRIGSDGKVGIGLTTWYQPYTKLIVGGAIAYNNNTDGAVSDNSYGQSFAKKLDIVAGSGANTIYSAAGSEAALYVITGLNLTASTRFADVVLYLGAGSTAPVVIASQTYAGSVTRTYANSGENLTLSLTGNSNTYTIRMTGMGANEKT